MEDWSPLGTQATIPKSSPHLRMKLQNSLFILLILTFANSFSPSSHEAGKLTSQIWFRVCKFKLQTLQIVTYYRSFQLSPFFLRFTLMFFFHIWVFPWLYLTSSVVILTDGFTSELLTRRLRCSIAMKLCSIVGVFVRDIISFFFLLVHTVLFFYFPWQWPF